MSDENPYLKYTQSSIGVLVRAASGCSGQSHHCRRFLLGLYNPEEWPFELNRLRALDSELQYAALDLLRFITINARREVHHYIDGGDAVLKRFWAIERGDPLD